MSHPTRPAIDATPPRSAPTLARSSTALALALALSACALAPPYTVPETPQFAGFKEAEGWVPAAPADTLDRGPWWALFDDPVLAALQQRVAAANQNVAAASAAYAQARALLAEQRAALFPLVSLSGSATRSGGDRTGTGSSEGTRYQAAIGGSWEPDVWGRLRSGVTAAGAGA
jgi:outer membrane protein TolC